MVQHLQQLAFWNLVIRPPRAKYSSDFLGPKEFTFDGGRGRRRDLEIKTRRGARVQCSHFLPSARGLKRIPVVVYLHGNASNRMEAFDVVVPFLQKQISVFCYDAVGCGISDGDYISCGWYESQDLADIIKVLRKSPFCGPVALWGWSMGAVTALLYAARDHSITALCLESPFASLHRVCEDLATGGVHIVKLPGWLIDPVYALVKRQVQNLALFNIDDVVPLDSAPAVRTPAIFITRKNDTFIMPQHVEDIMAVYGGECEHMVLEGDHSCTRKPEDILKIVAFFGRSFLPDVVAAKLSSSLRCNNDFHSNDMLIPEEHEQERPSPTARRVSEGLPVDAFFESLALEPMRPMPRSSKAAGLGFPEPRCMSILDVETTEVIETLVPPRASVALGITSKRQVPTMSPNSSSWCEV